NLEELLERMDRTTPPGYYSLRRIFDETEVTLDMIRARVAHQAFAGGPPEAFWPPIRALLDGFAPELGWLVCGSLEMDPGYEAFWEPDVRELKALVGPQRPPQAEREEVTMSNATPEPESFLNAIAQFWRAGRQVEAEGDEVVFTPSS